MEKETYINYLSELHPAAQVTTILVIGIIIALFVYGVFIKD